LWNGLLEAWISCEGIQECKIVIVKICVWGKNTPIDQNISNGCRQGVKSLL
jgi:hypothetical protein